LRQFGRTIAARKSFRRRTFRPLFRRKQQVIACTRPVEVGAEVGGQIWLNLVGIWPNLVEFGQSWSSLVKVGQSRLLSGRKSRSVGAKMRQKQRSPSSDLQVARRKQSGSWPVEEAAKKP